MARRSLALASPDALTWLARTGGSELYVQHTTTPSPPELVGESARRQGAPEPPRRLVPEPVTPNAQGLILTARACGRANRMSVFTCAYDGGVPAVNTSEARQGRSRKARSGWFLHHHVASAACCLATERGDGAASQCGRYQRVLLPSVAAPPGHDQVRHRGPLASARDCS